jgi:hypothetical protein
MMVMMVVCCCKNGLGTLEAGERGAVHSALCSHEGTPTPTSVKPPRLLLPCTSTPTPTVLSNVDELELEGIVFGL